MEIYPIKITKPFKNNEVEIFHIENFGTSYGVEIDNDNNIYIPSFSDGYIFKVRNDLKKTSVLKIKNGKLENISFFEKFFFKSRLNKKINFYKGSFLRPHDIIFDKNNNMLITQMGLSYGGGLGKVDIVSNDMTLKKTLGLEMHNGKGMISPVMTNINDGLFYVTEFGADKILRFDENYQFIDWIGRIGEKNLDIENNSWSESKNFINISLKQPHAIKLGPDNNFYLVDSENHRIIKFDNNGELIGWIGKRDNNTLNYDWSNDGNSIKGEELGAFNVPIDLFFYKEFMYVSDCRNNRIVKLDLSGKSISWFGDTESENFSKNIWKNEEFNSILSNSYFGLNNPYGIRIKNDTIYIADKNNFRIKIVKFIKNLN
jgi:hypothetical protein